MARPSQNLDRKLLRAGRGHLTRRGSSRFSVRELCADAGVNLGMFHYHFRTKSAFISTLLEEIYSPMFARLNLAASAEGDPLERLRSALVVFGGWVSEHRVLLARLAADLLGGDKAVLAFVRTAESRHMAVIIALIMECQRAGRFPAGDPVELLIFIGGATFLPLLIGALAAGNRNLPTPIRTVFEEGLLFTETALRKRIDAALRGLATPLLKATG